jgi:hypothetical protein
MGHDRPYPDARDEDGSAPTSGRRGGNSRRLNRADFVAKVIELEPRDAAARLAGVEGFAPLRLGPPKNERGRRWTYELCEAPEVLGDRRQCELELRAARAS